MNNYNKYYQKFYLEYLTYTAVFNRKTGCCSTGNYYLRKYNKIYEAHRKLLILLDNRMMYYSNRLLM